MSEGEKAKRVEALLPSLSAIREAYRQQGRALTEAEAEAIREQMRQDMAAGHIDARDEILGDSALEKVAGGGGGNAQPTRIPLPLSTPTPTYLSYKKR